MIKPNVLEFVNRKKAELEGIRKQLDDLVSANITSIFNQVIFTPYPLVDSVSWSQYTPFFNDGDSCKFSVNHYVESLKVDGKSIDDQEKVDDSDIKNYWDGYNYVPNSKYDPKFDVYYDLSELLKTLGDPVLEMLYDDHVTVTVYRDGSYKVDVCEHE